MALSNWDTLAFDSEGQPGNGVLNGFTDGASVEIYKNWIYVRDRWMWRKDTGFVEPTIAKIDSGSVELSEFTIQAVRGPQEGVFCYAAARKSIYETDEAGKKQYVRSDYRRMAGIGCSGYADRWEQVMEEEKLDPEVWEPMWSGTGSKPTDGPEQEVFTFGRVGGDRAEKGSMLEVARPYEEYQATWVGVLPETLAEFLKWLEDEVRDDCGDGEFDEWLAKVKAAEPLRFNQGDAYFAARGVGEYAGTPVGEGGEPVLMQVIQGMKGAE